MTRAVRHQIACAATAAFACVVLGFPIWWMAITAVAPPGRIRTYPPLLLPLHPDWSGFAAVLFHRPLLRWIGNSIVVAGGATALSVGLAILGGYALSRYAGHFVRAAGLTVLVAKMIPATLIVIPLYVIFRRFGMVTNLTSIILAHCTLTIPFAIWMLKAYFDSIPRELEEAAMSDGCSAVGTLWRIVLPVAVPGLGATALYAFILSWNEFAFARTLLTGNPANWTVTVGLASIRGEYLTAWNEIMAASVLIAAPIMAVFVWLERYLVAGLTAGAQR